MQVPVYERQARQEGIPNVQQNIRVDASNFLGGTEAAALKYGEHAANELNSAVQHHYAEQLKEAKQTRLLDASTQMQLHAQDLMYGSNGALTKTGADAFLGSNGKTVSDLTFDDALKRQNEIADTLGDEEQKAAFKQHTNSMLMSMRGQLLGHEAQQHRAYTQSTLESSNAAQVNSIGLNYNDNDGIQKSIDQIKANSKQLASVTGNAPQWGDVHSQSSISSALNKVINNSLDKSDFATVHNVLQNFSKELNQDDLVTAYSKMQKAKGEATALSTAFSTIESIKPKLMPNQGDRFSNITSFSESSNRQWGENGQVLTSPDGAKGKWQLLESTGPEAAKLAGVDWDKKLFNQTKTADPELNKKAEHYNEILGKAYIQQQLQANQGDMQKAWGAYHAGPGKLKEAIAQGGDNWLVFLGPKSQAYVTKNTAAYNAGEGNPKQPSKEDAVYAAVNALPPGMSTDVVKATMQNTEHLYDLHQTAVKQNEDYVVAQVYTELSKNGGDLTKIPLSLKNQIPGEKINAIDDFAKSQGKGREHSDLAVYNHLSENPAFLMNLSPDQFVAYRQDLSESDWHALQNQRKALQNPSASDSPDNLDTQSVNAITNNLLSQVNVDTSPKDSDIAAKSRLGTIRKYINDSLLSQQAQTGKKFKEAEINSYITGLFGKDVELKKTFLGFNTGKTHQQLLLTQANQIPADIKISIIKAFKSHGIDTPTDGQILGSYLNGMGK